MNNKKSNILKIVLVTIDIIVIIGFIIISIIWFNNHNNSKNEDNTTTKETKTITYKKFTYEIPEDVSFKEIDDKKFELSNNNYRAIIEIFIDNNNYMFEKKDKYFKALLDMGYKVDEPYETAIGDAPIIIYNRYDDNNSMICHFKTPSLFTIELEVFNKDNSFDKGNIESLVKILRNEKYDYSSEEKYSYYDVSKDSYFKD